MVALMDIARNSETGGKKVNAFVFGCTTGSYSCHPAFENLIFIKNAKFFLI